VGSEGEMTWVNHICGGRPDGDALPQRSLIEEICNQLRPLKKKNVNIASEVRQRLELFDKVNPKLMPVTNAKAINTAAKLFRAKFRKDKLADLLRETLPYIFKALDEQFEQLEKIEGKPLKR
jgi:type I site-specific restriction endonuclease